MDKILFDVRKIRLDPWKSHNFFGLVLVSIDGDDPRNSSPKQQLDHEEEIHVFLVPVEGFKQNVSELASKHELKVCQSIYHVCAGIGLSAMI